MNIAGDERMCGKYLSPASESGRFLEMGYEKCLLLPPPPVSCCAPPRLPAPDPPLRVEVYFKCNCLVITHARCGVCIGDDGGV